MQSRCKCGGVCALLVTASTLVGPGEALAQYKNASFGLDLGGWLITKPNIYEVDGSLKPIDRRPLRLSSGLRIGGETTFKMSEDHWWFVGRFNVGFLRYAEDPADPDPIRVEFDRRANEALGTLVGLQGLVGIRYLLLTDRFRPYVQGSFSYLHLFSFVSTAGGDCIAGYQICAGGGNNASNFLPHPNVGGLHLETGVEMIFTRDIALRVFADVQNWIVLNAADNRAVVFGGGLSFFT